MSFRGLLSILARMMLCAVFFISAAGIMMPTFDATASSWEEAGIPEPKIAVAAAIAVMIVGSVLVIVGYYARIGAVLLMAFLAASTYYFHAVWKMSPSADPVLFQAHVSHVLKNVAVFGALFFILVNGAGPGSLDNRRRADRSGAPAP